jgi:hypothetical protein
MRHRARHRHDDLNRADYRGDFGPEGASRFANSSDRHHRDHHEGHDGRRHAEDPPFADEGRHRDPETRRWRSGHLGEGWQRGRTSGGYGSQFDAWSSGAGFREAGFGFGPEENPQPRPFEDSDWQVTRPARGRGVWAGDWEENRYRGRGPKGYRRSDERVLEDVCERLTDDRHVDASEISIDVRDGEVTLTGSVTSREQKRRAGECAEHVPGVHDVFNQLKVVNGR